MRNPYIGLWVFLILPILGWAQETRMDSLRQVISNTSNDSLRIRAYSDLGYEYEKQGNIAHADSLYRGAIHLAESLNYPFLLGQNQRYIGLLFGAQSQLDSALRHYEQAVTALSGIDDQGQLGKVLIDIGNVHYYKSNFDQGVQYLLEAAEYYEQKDDADALSIVYGNLGAIFFEQDDTEKSGLYHEKALAFAEEAGNMRRIAVSQHNLGGVWEKKDSLDKAEAFYLQALKTVEGQEDTELLSFFHNSMGSVYGKRKNYPRAIYHTRLAVENAPNLATVADFRNNLGHYYTEIGSYDLAEEELFKGLQITTELGMKKDKREGLKFLFELKEKQRTFQQAYEYALQYMALTDTLFDEEVNERVHRLSIQFQTEQKEKENLALVAENAEKALALEVAQYRIRQRTFWAILAIALLAASLAVLYFYMKSLQQKQRLAAQTMEMKAQQVRELEKEQLLVATRAMVAGEESERRRLARELHDGLGGLLSIAQLQFSQLAGVHAFLEQNKPYKHAADLLEKAGQELRHIAHNLMPESLVSMGLVVAIEDLCEEINFTHALKVEFVHHNMEKRLPQRYELGIYRIVQELLNNVIKHARANQVWVQLFRNAQEISLTVEDNGQGFKPLLMKQQEGAGLRNVRSRVAYLEGNMDLSSEKMKGTSIHIQVSILD